MCVKKIHLIVSLFCVFLIFCLSAINVCAFNNPPNDMSLDESEKDCQYWNQGNYSESIDSSRGYGSIAGNACNHFAAMYMMVKMGKIDPSKGEYPVKHFEDVRKIGAYRGTWGYCEYRDMPKIYGNDFSYVEDYELDEVLNMNGKFVNHSFNAIEGLSIVKELINKGYYVSACVSGSVTSGHLIFFDGVREDGKMSIGDSGFYGITFEDTYDSDTTFNYFEVFECKSTPSSNQPSIYDSNVLRNTTSKDIEEENSIFNSLILEKDLVGMPQKSNLKENCKPPVLIKDASGLSQSEKLSLQAIKDAEDAEDFTVYRVLNITLIVTGIVIVVYSLLLIMGLLFDRVNSFINISLVSVFTLGRLKVVGSSEDLTPELSKEGYILSKTLIIRVMMLLLFGCFLVSGVIPTMVYKFVNSIVYAIS